MLIIVGDAQFGDGGKGRTALDLSYDRRVVAGVRPMGANNAGHTVVHKGVKHKLHLVPASVVAGKGGLIGSGTAVNLGDLVDEIDTLRQNGVEPETVLDPLAHVILPWHLELDRIYDEAQGEFSAGSTRKGVAPVYGAKHERWGVRVHHFLHTPSRVEQALEHYADRLVGESAARAVRAGTYPCLDADFGTVDWFRREVRSTETAWRERIQKTREKFAPYERIVGDVAPRIEAYFKQGCWVIAENAQSSLLSVDSPGYPHTTSCNTDASGAWAGIGLGAREEWMGPVIGVAKAYVTRVGNGPLITELQGALADRIRERGKEYGTTTGRPRRVGWFDVPMVRYAIRASGFTSLALTKIDVLGGMTTVRMAESYDLRGSSLHTVPSEDYHMCRPNFKEFDGWPGFSTDDYRRQFEHGIDKISDQNLLRFVRSIEDRAGLPIKFVSYGEDSRASRSYL